MKSRNEGWGTERERRGGKSGREINRKRHREGLGWEGEREQERERERERERESESERIGKEKV